MGATLSDNALKVLEARYLLRDGTGNIIETPDGLFKRVAGAVSQAELTWGTEGERSFWETAFYKALSGLYFLPNSPALMNAGRPRGQLSACFVLPLDDSVDSIFTTLKQAAIIQQGGGGTGFDFSRLRCKGDVVGGTGGWASGPVSFIKVFNAATEQIRQAGKRRGANMGVLRIDHPDIESFIACKQQEGALSSFNLSVGVTDAFMKALYNDEDWALIHPVRKTSIRSVKAGALWEAMAQQAWQTGDPGVLFLDTINAGNPTPTLGMIEATNPCGEVPLLPNEACNLGSVNLTRFIRQRAGGDDIDWALLGGMIHLAVRFLDDTIDCNHIPFDDIARMVRANRKIGLGVMGWADTLARLGIAYDTEEAIRLAGKVMQFFRDESQEASAVLAAQRGSFPNWKRSVYYPDIPLRNASRLSIAPTGTISIIAGVSSSIEPMFAPAYRRQLTEEARDTLFFSSPFLEYLRRRKLLTPVIIDEVLEKGSVRDLRVLPPEARDIFKTALEIPPSWHLRHQAAFQEYTDNGVSKTINLPESTTAEEIAHLYRAAWELRLKGVTVFRHNCRQSQVLRSGMRAASDVCKVCVE